ncbi:flavin reductase family protein [Ideonella sp. BN130291]|uniref:flavin reductase family protein n=1 Tax=Ideonella sp. BN130291 TaxID=3112940 RepID=UPI002E253DEB|nr:flavin reductase family protein [Ideonella sp. BN130291]
MRVLRSALGGFATGVTIVTCVDGAGHRVGLTANSFTALSLEPPLVLWSLRSASPSLNAFASGAHFAINVLGEGQVALSRRFASPVADKFAEGVWHAGLGGVPVLNEAAAVFECELVSQQEAGDHVLFIGRVLHFADGSLAPLVFHGGRYHRLGPVL